MVHPGSAAVISAASSARPPGPSAIAVTPSRLPGLYGAATVTATSAVRSPPGGGFSMTNGRRVVTPGPSTRTVTGAGAGASAPGGSPVPGGPPGPGRPARPGAPDPRPGAAAGADKHGGGLRPHDPHALILPPPRRAAHAAPRWVPASPATARTSPGLTSPPQAFSLSARP